MRATAGSAQAVLVTSASCDGLPVPSIWSRHLVLLLTAEFALLAAFYLLISVVPLLAAREGGAAAGLATGTMMLSTVATELTVDRFLARYGYRIGLIAGAVLLGVPVLALIPAPGLPVILAVCLVRGAGLGVVVVAGPALAAELVPATRRGEGLGLYGVAVGLPSVLGLPLGVWLARLAGFDAVFLAGAVIPLAAIGSAAGLPRRAGRAERRGRVAAGWRGRGLARPGLVFAATTLAAGVIVTFLPLAVPGWSGRLAPTALLAYAASAPLTRWAAGRYGDRRGSGRLLVPSALVVAVGAAGLLDRHSPLSVLVGMTLFGAGFGAEQNVTLTLMLERVPRTEFGRVSVLWNLAYDAGMGVGAVVFGLLVSATSYLAGFAVITAVLLVGLIPARRDQAEGPS
jgi:predicted MFS family arabinose efflux permease